MTFLAITPGLNGKSSTDANYSEVHISANIQSDHGSISHKPRRGDEDDDEDDDKGPSLDLRWVHSKGEIYLPSGVTFRS